MRRATRALLLPVIALLLVGAWPQAATANHPWEKYHWARKSNPMAIHIIDSMSSSWDARLNAVNSDWNQSSVLQNVIEAGSAKAAVRSQCPFVKGKIRACNANYGGNGWLGLAEISIVGGHIIEGRAKQNEYYFSKPGYNTEEARRHVLCQEIGHLFGMAHNRRSGLAGPTGMNDVAGINNSTYESPNAHDYALLENIYTSHKDGSTSISSKSGETAGQAEPGEDPSGRRNGGSSYFVREAGNGVTIVTHVLWADPAMNLADDHDHGDHEHADATGDDQRGRNPRSAADPAASEAPVGAEPVAPTGLTAQSRGGRVVLTWDDVATGEDAYRVYRSDDGETWIMVAELGAGTERWVDRDGETGTSYRVSAANEGGESWSAPVSARRG